MIRCGRHPSPAVGAAGEPAPGLHTHEPIQLVILVVVQLRLVQLADVHRHRTDVTIIQRTIGRADVGTVTREGVARSVDGQIIPGKIVQLESVSIPSRYSTVLAHVPRRIQRHAVDAFQPPLQGVGIVYALDLLLSKDCVRQRPVFIVAVKGFMILQYIGTNQCLVAGSVYIGDTVLLVTDLLLEKSLVNKIIDIQRLNSEDKAHVFALLDAFLQSHKAKNVFAY